MFRPIWPSSGVEVLLLLGKLLLWLLLSGYSNHMLNMGHTYGSMADTMKVLKTEKKGKHLNTLEKYHIYKTSKEGLQMNDTYIETHNSIFEVIQEINDR
jgi:hypothetical protein